MRHLLTGLVALTITASAGAAVRTTDDATQPATRAYSDLTGLTVRNGVHRIVADLRILDLRPNRTSAYLILSSSHDPHSSYSIGTQSNGHRHRPVFAVDAGKTTCPGVRVSLDRARSLVHVSVPVRCLPHTPSTLRASGLTELPADGADEDTTRSLIVPRG